MYINKPMRAVEVPPSPKSDYETPEKALPVIDKHDDMKALIKVLSNINNNLQKINKTLRRMK